MAGRHVVHVAEAKDRVGVLAAGSAGGDREDELRSVDVRGVVELGDVCVAVVEVRVPVEEPGVEESVVETIRGNLSERARTALDEEAELLGPTPRSEVEAAHAEIVDVVRRMEADGTITIHRGGTEDLL